jgi:hypothetical protein
VESFLRNNTLSLPNQKGILKHGGWVTNNGITLILNVKPASSVQMLSVRDYVFSKVFSKTESLSRRSTLHSGELRFKNIVSLYSIKCIV